jgi:hypothetical protein
MLESRVLRGFLATRPAGFEPAASCSGGEIPAPEDEPSDKENRCKEAKNDEQG